MRIGILGGSFDPIHYGHLIVAEEVRIKIGLDKIIFIPVHIPPHKTSPLLSTSTRYRLVKKAIKNNSFFSVSDVEIKRKGKSYTWDTLLMLKKTHPRNQFYVIIGADEATQITSWRNYRQLLTGHKFIIVNRPGYALEKKLDKTIRARVKIIKTREIDISSSEIRRRITTGQSIKYLVPESVEEHLAKLKIKYQKSK